MQIQIQVLPPPFYFGADFLTSLSLQLLCLLTKERHQPHRAVMGIQWDNIFKAQAPALSGSTVNVCLNPCGGGELVFCGAA